MININTALSLNSTMVRLKRKEKKMKDAKKYISLNSTMVRLKRKYDPEIVYNKLEVSIPLWFD